MFLRRDFHHQADGERLLGRDRIAEENHFFGFGRADQTRQSLRAAAAGKGADLYFRQTEARRLRGDAKIRGQRQLAAAAERITGHRGDHRLRQRLDLVEQNLKLARVAVGGFGVGVAAHLADVRAGAKNLVAAGDDHRS